jgi:iron complex transport system substrate-binding protein
VLVLCFAALLGGATTCQAATPQRVVSINLCADQALLALAPLPMIAGVSVRVDDEPDLAQRAANVPRVAGRVEAVLARNPDLVLASVQSSRALLLGLQSFDIRVELLPAPESIAEVAALVQQVGRALGRNAAAAQHVASMYADLQRVAPQQALPAADSGPLAALYLPNGFTAGEGTLADALMQRAGVRNLARRLGLQGNGWLSLETLVLAQPDWVLSEPNAGTFASLAQAKVQHPILGRLQGRVVPLSVGSGSCAGPQIVAAVARLAALRGGRP